MFFALLRKRPIDCTYGMRPSTPSFTIAPACGRPERASRVALLTPLSVACADSTTATSSSNGERWTSSDLGSGSAARNRSKIRRRFCGFICQCARLPRGRATRPGARERRGDRFGFRQARRGRRRRPARPWTTSAGVAVETRRARCARRSVRSRPARRRDSTRGRREPCRCNRRGRAAGRARSRCRARAAPRACAWRADDRIDRARIDAQRAADAPGFIDARDRERRVLAVRAIESNDGAAGQRRQRGDERVAAGRAAVDRVAGRDRLGIGAAGVVAAAPALRLRKECVDAAHNIHEGDRRHRPF